MQAAAQKLSAPAAASETLSAPEEAPLMHRAAVWEVLCFLGVAFAVDSAFFGGDRFAGFMLHPFWLIVLAVSVQYGMAEGVFAAALASAALLVGNLPVQHLDENAYSWLLRVSALPLLWFAGALIFGGIRQRQRRVQEELRSALAKTRHHARLLHAGFVEMRRRKEEIETRLAQEWQSHHVVHEAARSMNSLDREAIHRALFEAVRDILRFGAFSVYREEGGALIAVATHGWREDDTFPSRFCDGSALYAVVVRQACTLCVSRAEDEAFLDALGLYAVPILDEASGRVYGMVKVERANIADFSARNRELLRLLACWAGQALANASRFRAVAESVHVRREPAISATERGWLETFARERPGILVTPERAAAGM